MFRHFMIGFIAVAAASVIFAQEPPPKAFFFQRFGPGPDGPPPGGDNVSFVSAEMAFESKPVTGAPYTAQAVTETTQTLSDGNRISQTTQGLVARDSEGRTRREQSMPPLPGAQGDAMKLVFINDPVAQVNYVLHADRTAEQDAAHESIHDAAGRWIHDGCPIGSNRRCRRRGDRRVNH